MARQLYWSLSLSAMVSHAIKGYLHSIILLISTVIHDVLLAEHSGPIDDMGPSGMLMCHEQY